MKYDFPSNAQLKAYADLAIKVGVNLQKSQELVISTDVKNHEFAHILAKSAYENGAVKVLITYSDEIFSHIRMINEKIESVSEVEKFKILEKNYAVEKKTAYITVISDDPELFSDIKSETLAECNKNKMLVFKKFYSTMTKNGIRWNIIAIPSVAWAKKIFPLLSDEQAVNKLWHFIFKTVYLYDENPIATWKAHTKKLSEKCAYLNSLKLQGLRYKNSLGTDLYIGLPKNYLFEGGSEKAKDDVDFCANIPTEEIFSAPDKNCVNGKAVASLPLIYNGNRIENFGFIFENGRIADFWAEKGKDILKNLLDTDEGSHYLGEVALVQYNSPINNLKTIFYETLFDENASCHLAIGEAYPTCVKGGDKMSRQQLEKIGVNFSLEHVDFMIGTADLNIKGIKQDGSSVEIFRNGSFCF